MLHNKNDNELNAQRGVNKPQESPWTTDITDLVDNEDWSEVNARATASFTTQDSSFIDDNNRDASSNSSSSRLGRSGLVTVVPTAQSANPGFTQGNNGNAQRSFSSSSIWGNNNGTVGPEAGFTNNFAPVINNDEGYNSDPDFGNNLDNGSKADDKPGRLAQIRQKLAKLVGADPNKKFSEWPQKQQIHASGIIGGLFAVGAPIAVVGAVVVGIGAVVLGIIFGAGYLLGGGLATIKAAGIKTGQGFSWAAQKTNEGAQRVVEKTREAYAVADQRVRKAASDALRSVANRLEKMAGHTNHPEELSNLGKTTIELYNETLAVLNDKVLKNSDFSQEEKEAIVAAAMGKIAFKLGLKVKAQEDIIENPNTIKEDREEAQEYNGLWTKQQSFIRGLNFEKLENLLNVTYKSASRDLYLFKTALADHHEEVKSAVHEAVEKFLEYKQERANDPSNAAGKPKPIAVVKPLDGTSRAQNKSKFFGWFSRKPKVVAQKPLVEGGGSTDTSTTTLVPNRVHFADVLNQGETIPIVTSSRVTGYGTVSSSNSIFGSDNTLNNGSSDSGINSPVAGSPKRMNDQTRVAALTKLFENFSENPDTDVTLKPSDVNQHASTSALGQAQ